MRDTAPKIGAVFLFDFTGFNYYRGGINQFYVILSTAWHSIYITDFVGAVFYLICSSADARSFIFCSPRKRSHTASCVPNINQIKDLGGLCKKRALKRTYGSLDNHSLSSLTFLFSDTKAKGSTHHQHDFLSTNTRVVLGFLPCQKESKDTTTYFTLKNILLFYILIFSFMKLGIKICTNKLTRYSSK